MNSKNQNREAEWCGRVLPSGMSPPHSRGLSLVVRALWPWQAALRKQRCEQSNFGVSGLQCSVQIPPPFADTYFALSHYNVPPVVVI